MVRFVKDEVDELAANVGRDGKTRAEIASPMLAMTTPMI